MVVCSPFSSIQKQGPKSVDASNDEQQALRAKAKKESKRASMCRLSGGPAAEDRRRGNLVALRCPFWHNWTGHIIARAIGSKCIIEVSSRKGTKKSETTCICVCARAHARNLVRPSRHRRQTGSRQFTHTPFAYCQKVRETESHSLLAPDSCNANTRLARSGSGQFANQGIASSSACASPRRG